MSRTCHNDCECDSSEYIPLCHEGMSYKSPCLAGCTGHYMQGDEIVNIPTTILHHPDYALSIGCTSPCYFQFYTGCLCERNATIPQGICKDDACYAPYIYLICTTLASAVYVLCAPAAVNLTLRYLPPLSNSPFYWISNSLDGKICRWIQQNVCNRYYLWQFAKYYAIDSSPVHDFLLTFSRSVSADDKGLALGLQSTLNSLMGWIPAPILFGAVIDSTCTIWEYSDAGGVTQNWKGSCKEYDNKAYQLK